MSGTVADVVERLEFQDDLELDWRVEEVKIPYRKIDAETLEKARAYLAAKPTPYDDDPLKCEPEYEWVFHATVLETHSRGPDYDYEIQTIRIGETAFIGLPGEPFVEAGLKIKLESPANQAYVVHMPRWPDCSYIATARGFDNGGYEAGRDVAKFARESLDLITQAAIDQVKELFGGSRR